MNTQRSMQKGRSRPWSGTGPTQPEQAMRRSPSQQQRALQRADRRARGLAWFSIGLGVAQLLAPRRVGKMIGVGGGMGGLCLGMRAIGARELLAGIGILRSSRAAPWLWSRVAGDAMDLALLGRSLQSSGGLFKSRKRISMAMLAVGGVAVLDVLTSRQLSRRTTGMDQAAPTRTTPVRGFITINRSPEEMYAFWRNFENLSRFMANVDAVQIVDQFRSHWKVTAAPGKTVQWDASVTEDRANELIAWRTLRGAEVAHAGVVRFLRAPGGRGTEVRVEMQVIPPGGVVGAPVAKLGRKIPEQMLRNDLHRLKQIMEVGEIVKSDATVTRGPHPGRPDAKRPY